MEAQFEDVGSSVVTRRIQLPLRSDKLMGLHVCVEDPLLRLQRTRHGLSIRVDDHAESRVHPSVHATQVLGFELELVGDVVFVKGLAYADDKAPTFLCYVPHGGGPGLTPIPCRCNVNLLTPCGEGVASQGHVVLPTQEAADSGERQ